MVAIGQLEKILSLQVAERLAQEVCSSPSEKHAWPRTSAFGKFDADFTDLVPFHCRHSPDQALPLDLIANHRFTADLLADKAA
jgi:hypothetical protein